MKRKFYIPPQSRHFEIRTEQGICYSSNEEATIDKEASTVEANEHIRIENDITFE